MSTSTELRAKTNLGKKKALIIGISKYDKLQPLDLCENDAEELSRILGEQGYEISEMYKLIGYVPYESLKQTIIRFFKGNKREETLLLYYSGHGLPDGRGKHYLAPSDIDPESPFDKGFDFEVLQYIAEGSNSSKRLTILDCCFSGAARLEGETSKANDIAIAQEARNIIDTRMRESEGTYLLASSLAFQQSVIKKDLHHSLFTYYLLEGLKGKEHYIDSYGYVTADHLHNYIFDKMSNEERIPQKPIKKSRVSGDIMVAYHPYLARHGQEPAHLSSTLTAADISAIMYEGFEHKRYEEYDEALKCFNQAISIDPKNYVPYKNKGDILDKLGRNDEAIQAYDKAINSRPDDPYAYNLKGDVYFKLGDYHKALEYYNRACKIKPKSLEFLKDKGRALYELEDYEHALECFSEALIIKPNHDEVTQYKKEALLKYDENTCISLYEKGKYDDALECFNRILEANSKSAQILYYKGLTLAKLSRDVDANSCFDEAREIDPKYEVQKALQKVEYLNRAKANQQFNSLMTKGSDLVQSRRFKDALETFDSAIQIFPKNADAYAKKSYALIGIGQFNAALEAANTALHIDPRNIDALLDIGCVHSATGQYEKAIEFFDRATEIDPKNVDAWIGKGDCYTRTKRTKEAKDSFNIADSLKSSQK